MDPFLDLAQTWRAEALTLRERYGNEPMARLCEVHATDLEDRARRVVTEAVTLDQAARISGYSKAHLRRLMDGGRIANVGRPGAPRVRVGDLPVKSSPSAAKVLHAMQQADRTEDEETARIRADIQRRMYGTPRV